MSFGHQFCQREGISGFTGHVLCGQPERRRRIYQQTFVDTYSKVAHCKLYVTKTPITAADLLNDRVLPFYESQGLPMLRILTDRGTESCGKVCKHTRFSSTYFLRFPGFQPSAGTLPLPGCSGIHGDARCCIPSASVL